MNSATERKLSLVVCPSGSLPNHYCLFQVRRLIMAKHKGAEHHERAAEHHQLAAHHHREAAKHYEAGKPEKAGHHAHIAHGHHLHATYHAEEAGKRHATEYGGQSKTGKA